MLAWSPRMDILALGLATGHTALYRLQWQRVWNAPPAGEARQVSRACLLHLECTLVLQVRALAWRPDGKLLAAGDSAGTITIRHIGRVTNARSAAITVKKQEVRKHNTVNSY